MCTLLIGVLLRRTRKEAVGKARNPEGLLRYGRVAEGGPGDRESGRGSPGERQRDPEAEFKTAKGALCTGGGTPSRKNVHRKYIETAMFRIPLRRAAGAREIRHVSHVPNAASGVLSVPLAGLMPDNGCSDSVAMQ